MKHLNLIFGVILSALCFMACNPAEDIITVTHTIANSPQKVNVVKDTLPNAAVVTTVEIGSEVNYPNSYDNGWTHVTVGAAINHLEGYIPSRYIQTDTTIVTHSSILREKHHQKITPTLDEKYDSFAMRYVDSFPVKRASFWTMAIIIAIGIAIFHGTADIKIPLGIQLFGILIYAPFAAWIAFYTHLHGLAQIDGFLPRLILIVGMLALMVFMILSITASVGKIAGHNFTFKYCTTTTMGVYLIYLGVAYLHSLSDFFFKVLIFIYIMCFVYFVITRFKQLGYGYMSREEKVKKYAVEIILLPIRFVLTTAFITCLMAPMQAISSVLITQLFGVLIIVFIGGSGLIALGYDSSDKSKKSNKPYLVGPVNDGSGLYEWSDGTYRDEYGVKYEKDGWANGKYTKKSDWQQ